jgi:hypothetical protein
LVLVIHTLTFYKMQTLHMQTWSSLLQPERSILTAAPDNSHLPLGVVAAAAAVFTATIQSALEDAAKSAHEVGRGTYHKERVG